MNSGIKSLNYINDQQSESSIINFEKCSEIKKLNIGNFYEIMKVSLAATKKISFLRMVLPFRTLKPHLAFLKNIN